MRILNDKKILSVLRCPICGSEMSICQNGGASMVCGGPRTHCFDLSSSGYVNLCAPKQSGGGDSKQAVRARSEFLDMEYYRPVADALCDTVNEYCDKGSVVLDAGCGEGYYSLFPARNGFSVLGADLSKFAVEAASKRASREGLENTFFTTASVFELPVNDSSVGAIINIFAPCAEPEFSRAMKDDGLLIVAWAGERHLMGLKQAIYNTAHINSERADLPKSMEVLHERRVSYTIDVDSNESIMSLFAMTPYYWRTSQTDGEKLKDLSSLTTEVDIIISVYRNNKSN